MSFWWTKFIETDSMKKIIGILAVLGLSFACQQVELPVEQEQVSGPEFTAQAEMFGAQTKTAMDGNAVVWNSGDQIAIFQGLSTADKYQVKENGIGRTSATFEIIAKGNGSNSTGLPVNVAIYPYESDLICAPVILENGTVTSYQILGVTFPSTQTYAANSFADESFLMAAITSNTEDHTLNFKNICGALKLQLKGTGKVKSIELKGNDNEPLSGEATVTVYPGKATPIVAMSSDASQTVILDCGEGVQLSEDAATDFLITIPPTAFKKGFSAMIIDVEGGTFKLETSQPNAVKRSYVHGMPEVQIKMSLDDPILLSYWKEYLDQKINEINQLADMYGDDADCFIYIADQHRPTGASLESAAINYITNRTSIRNVIMGGDIVQGSDNDVELLEEYVKSFSKNVRILPMRGNHEIWGNLTAEDFWEIGIKPLQDYAVVSEKLWYYYDNPTLKIRYIMTDSTYSSSDGTDNLTSEEQITWMQDRILELDENWTVLVFHHGIWTASKTAQMPINNDGQLMIDSMDEIYDQADCKIAGLYAAHCHRDYSQTSDKGYLLVGTTLDCCHSGQSSYDINNPTRTKGTTDEHSFDVAFFIPKEKTIKTIRIGAGQDRELKYSQVRLPEESISEDITPEFNWTPGTCTWATGGVQSTDTYWLYSNAVDISEYKKLTFTHCQTITVGTTLGYCFYDASMNHILGESNTGVSYIPVKKTIDIPEGAVYFRCMWMNTTSPHYTTDNDISNFSCSGIYSRKILTHHVNSPYDFSGKKAYFFGDSITYGYIKNADGTASRATKGGYPGFFSEAVGLTHTNYGVSGSLFGTYNNLGRIGDKIKNRSLDCDFLFVAGGINDWQCGVSLSDFRQSVEEVCSYIDANFDGEVIFITPINHSGRKPLVEPVAQVQEYREIITEIALSHDFSVVQGGLFGFPTTESPETEKTLMFCDNLHPTEYGYEFYANCLIEVLGEY